MFNSFNTKERHYFHKENSGFRETCLAVLFVRFFALSTSVNHHLCSLKKLSNEVCCNHFKLIPFSVVSMSSRQQKMAEREKRSMEQQRKKMEKEVQRMMKKDQKIAVKLS